MQSTHNNNAPVVAQKSSVQRAPARPNSPPSASQKVATQGRESSSTYMQISSQTGADSATQSMPNGKKSGAQTASESAPNFGMNKHQLSSVLSATQQLIKDPKLSRDSLAVLAAWSLAALSLKNAAKLQRWTTSMYPAVVMEVAGLVAKDERNENMRAAQRQAKKSLAGRAPREVGAEIEAQVLRWVYRWGWSSSSILDRIRGHYRAGYTKRLVRKGLLAEHESHNPGGIAGMPRKLITLTSHGLTVLQNYFAAQGHDEWFDNYPSNPYRAIKFSQLRHDFVVQRITAEKWLADESMTDYKTGREIAQDVEELANSQGMSRWSREDIKQPDAVWIIDEIEWIGFELELTPKKGREQDLTVKRLIQAVSKPGEFGDSSGFYDKIMIGSPFQQGILNHYIRMLTPGNKVQIHRRTTAGWSAIDGDTFEVPKWALERIKFRKIKLTPGAGEKL